MSLAKTQVVIVGAGYAGMMAALRLAGKVHPKKVDLTLVNAADSFIERPRLHELATNTPLKQRPLAHMLRGTGIRFVQGWVVALHADLQQIEIRSEVGLQQIQYDYLIYALGSVTDRHQTPGVDAFAYTLDSSGPMSALPLRDHLLRQAETGGKVVVVGSGPTGIEVSAEIAELFPTLEVTLATQGGFGQFRDLPVQKVMRRGLEKLGITILEQASVAQVEENRLVMQSGMSLPFDICVWSGGFKALPLAGEAGLTVNERGQAWVDPFMRSVSHPSIFVVGDAGEPLQQPGAPTRMSLFVALVMGAHAADSLARILAGKSPKPLGYSTYGQGIALGRKNAVGFLTFPNDRRTGPMLTGKTGLFIRSFFVALIVVFLEVERRFPGFFFWFGRGRGKNQAQQPNLTTKTGPATFS